MNRPQHELDLAESLTDALREVIKALGGPKKVAPRLRPERSVDDATRWLLDCINPDRQEHLYPDQLLWLLCEARTAGCHLGMHYIARAAGYAPPAPVEPRDELAELQRTYIESVNLQRQIADRMEKLTRAPIAAVKSA